MNSGCQFLHFAALYKLSWMGLNWPGCKISLSTVYLAGIELQMTMKLIVNLVNNSIHTNFENFFIY